MNKFLDILAGAILILAISGILFSIITFITDPTFRV